MERYAFDQILLQETAEIMAQEMPKRVKEIRLSVVNETRKCLSRYARLGYMPELLCAIAEKKCAKLKTISTKEEARRLSQPRCPACALPGFVDSKNEEKTERNAGYLVVSHSGGGMLRQGTRKGIRRTPANRGMRAHRIVKSLDISEDVCHGLCP